MIGMKLGGRGARQAVPGALRPVCEGDYFCSERDLFRIEQLMRDHALVEDCRTGDLFDLPVGDLAALQRVEHG